MSNEANVLQKGVYDLWVVGNLDYIFKTYYTYPGPSDDFFTLVKNRANPGQPMPYCVTEFMKSKPISRMTDGEKVELKRVIKDTLVVFTLYTKQVGETPAEEIAANLADEITKVYGGHRSVPCKCLTLDYGTVILQRLEDSQGVWAGEEEYLWEMTYRFRVDDTVAEL